MRFITLLSVVVLLLAVSTQAVVAQDRVSDGVQVLYNFAEGSGTTVQDLSDDGDPLDLTISDLGAVTWLPGGGLVLDSATILSSVVPATKIFTACQTSQGLTVEAWAASDHLSQFGPARLVTYTQDGYPNGGNFMLGQSTTDLDMRMRTTTTDKYGRPGLLGAGEMSTALQHLVFTRNPAGATALYVDGVLVNSGTSAGNFSADSH